MSANSHCYAVVLAAGRATRFGSSKLLESVDGVTLVARAVKLSRAVCEQRSLLVVGYDKERVRDAAGEEVVGHVVNDRFADGLSTSIHTAIDALEHCADAVLILLADQAAITAAHLTALLDAASADCVAATAYVDTIGPPAVFPRAQFAALKRLHGDAGAKQFLLDNAAMVKSVRFEGAACDIDTPEDLATFT